MKRLVLDLNDSEAEMLGLMVENVLRGIQGCGEYPDHLDDALVSLNDKIEIGLSQEPPKGSDSDPTAVYVIINVDEPDDRQFWSNDQGWVSDLESATTWVGADVSKVCPPMSGGWIKKEVFL